MLHTPLRGGTQVSGDRGPDAALDRDRQSASVPRSQEAGNHAWSHAESWEEGRGRDVTDEPIDPELDRLLGLLAEEERGAPDPAEHPGAATLSSYHSRTLPADEVSRVQDHIVACRQCREQLLEYAQFMAPASEEPAGDVSSFERTAEWRRLKERMGAEAAAPEPLPVKAADDRRRILRSLRAFQVLAAALGTLAIGLVLRDVHFRGQARVLPEQAI